MDAKEVVVYGKLIRCPSTLGKYGKLNLSFQINLVSEAMVYGMI